MAVNYPANATAGAVNVYIAYTDKDYGFNDWTTNTLTGGFEYKEVYLRLVPDGDEVSRISYSPSMAAPAEGVFAVKTQRLVSTNNPAGYSLALEPENGEVDLACSTNDELSIKTIEASGSLNVGTYGWKINSSNQNGVNSDWRPMSAAQTIKTVTSAATNDAINLWFGARLDATIPACGSYDRRYLLTAIPRV
jgi:hypothetical protein